MDIGALHVNNAVVHYVPTTSDERMLLTDSAVTLDAQLRSYFRDKVIGTLTTRGLDVVVDAVEQQNVPEAVAAIIDTPAQLVEASRSIASHLYACQSARNSSGLIVVLDGIAGETPVVAIVKLERERGVRFVLSEQDGRQVVDLELLRNLTLTDKTKVFKTALLTSPLGGGPAAVTGRVSDDQRGRTEGLPVAHFFLSTFLGCQPKVKAAKRRSTSSRLRTTRSTKTSAALRSRGAIRWHLWPRFKPKLPSSGREPLLPRIWSQ